MTAAKTRTLDHADYVRFRDLVLSRTGLHYPEKRRDDLERNLLEGLAGSGLKSADEYYQALAASPPKGLMGDLVHLLTIGETYFNRDSAQLDLLRREILPKLIEKRLTTNRSLRIWSAGCATGEEPYSLSIILHELIPYIDNWDVSILATDINREFLRKAEQGRYGSWSFRNMPQDWLDKYFFLANTSNYHLSDAIKDIVSFQYLNFKDDFFPSIPTNTVDIDLIVCRNVRIYFDEKTNQELATRFHACLAEGGWLLSGASDPIPPRDLFFTRNYSGAFIYQKKTPGFEARASDRAGHSTAPKVRPGALRKNDQIKPPKPAKKARKIDTLTECATLLEIGQPSLAAEKLRKELQINPSSVEALLLMAKAEVAQGSLDKAEEYAEKVTIADRLDVRGHYLLSAIHQSRGDTELAIKHLKRTLYVDSGYIQAHFTLGCLYKQQNRDLLARKSFNNALKLMDGSPKDEIVPEAHGITYEKLREIVEANLRRR